MTTFNTDELLSSLEQQTEKFLQKAVSQWQMTSPLKLKLQPHADKWSAAQCLEHLNSYGRYYLPQIESAIELAKDNRWTAASRFKAGWLGNYFTKLMAPAGDGQKVKKMSSPKNHVPRVDLNSDQVVSEFISQQEKLLALLDKAREINLEKAKVPVSIAKFIRLKLGDTFRFLIAHNHRHVLQAETALSQSQKVVEVLL